MSAPSPSPRDRLIVALDVATPQEAKRLVEELEPWVGCFKIGLELMTAIGAPEATRLAGGRVFLDGKFCDIPSTVAGAARAAASLGVAYFNVHASCGREAISAAAREKGKSKLLAVTVLTSIGDAECARIFGREARDKVLEFALDAADCGADGIVCSPADLAILSSEPSLARLERITPGVRPSWAGVGDQARVMTPGEAIRAGATALVIGRPITRPPVEIGSPADAAKRICDEIREALPG